MAKVITFGEIMLRLSTPGYLRFNQARQFEATFGGGAANVAVSLANYGIETELEQDIVYTAVTVSESISWRRVQWPVQARSYMTVHILLSLRSRRE